MFKETRISTYPNPGKEVASPAMEPDFMKLQVAKKQALAGGIYLFELRHPDGSELPAFTAGAHLTVEVPSGVRRNYSR